jgi:hypothetical protein
VKRYFKHEADDFGLGPGVAYFEFDGELPTRQIEHYGDRWFSSIERYHPGIGTPSRVVCNDNRKQTDKEREKRFACSQNLTNRRRALLRYDLVTFSS